MQRCLSYVCTMRPEAFSTRSPGDRRCALSIGLLSRCHSTSLTLTSPPFHPKHLIYRGCFIGSQSIIPQALLNSRALGHFLTRRSFLVGGSPIYFGCFGLIVNSPRHPASLSFVFPWIILGNVSLGLAHLYKDSLKIHFLAVLRHTGEQGPRPYAYSFLCRISNRFRRCETYPMLVWVPSPPEWEVGT